MFKLRVADYINSNMLERGLTYKDVSRMSGVSDSSIHTYAQAKVTNPNEDNLIRIAAAFGDPPDIIQQMRREALSSTTEENKIIAQSSDKERMEEFSALMRSNVAALLEEYRIQSAAQQTEIIQHADQRIANEEARFKKRVDEVIRQYEAEMEKERMHAQTLLNAEKEHRAELRSRNEATRGYLKTMVRNLTIALVAVAIFSAVGFAALGGYAVYAYNTFDLKDPTRGIYQETPAPEVESDRINTEG